MQTKKRGFSPAARTTDTSLEALPMLTTIIYGSFFGSALALVGFGVWGVAQWRGGVGPAPVLILPAWVFGVVTMAVPAFVCGAGEAQPQSQACTNLTGALTPVFLTYVFGTFVIVVTGAALGRLGSAQLAGRVFALAFWACVVTPLAFFAYVHA